MPALEMELAMSLRSWFKPRSDTRKLRRPVQYHLGIDLAEAHSVGHEIQPAQRVNIQRVLDGWAADATTAVQGFGFSTVSYLGHDGLVKYLMTDELIQGPL